MGCFKMPRLQTPCLQTAIFQMRITIASGLSVQNVYLYAKCRILLAYFDIKNRSAERWASEHSTPPSNQNRVKIFIFLLVECDYSGTLKETNEACICNKNVVGELCNKCLHGDC